MENDHFNFSERGKVFSQKITAIANNYSDIEPTEMICILSVLIGEVTHSNTVVINDKKGIIASVVGNIFPDMQAELSLLVKPTRGQA